MTMSIQNRVDLVTGVGSDGRTGAISVFTEKNNRVQSATAANRSQMRPHSARNQRVRP